VKNISAVAVKKPHEDKKLGLPRGHEPFVKQTVKISKKYLFEATRGSMGTGTPLCREGAQYERDSFDRADLSP
jgi:hypothetical protein